MTTPTPTPPPVPFSYWHCQDGSQHTWIYRRPAGKYRCIRCDAVVTKAELKEHTDTD